VNHVTTEEAQDAPGVVLGTFSVNSVPATVLFDSGASHSFITEQFVAKHDIPMSLKDQMATREGGVDRSR
jgi:hypothetical protein